MNRDEIIAILTSHREELARLGVRSLSVFGSAARGEAAPGSDVDLLVDFDRPTGLIAFVRLQMLLETWLGRPVDLATPEGLRPDLRERVLGEAVRAA